MPDGYQFSTPDEPKPSRYSSFARGLIGGFLDDIQGRKQRESQLESEARGNALKWVLSQPMSEQNAPIISKMALDILASKPGKKSTWDQIFGRGEASGRYIDDLWTKLRNILPQDEAASAEAMSERIPIGDGRSTPVTVGEEITRYRSPQFGEWAKPPLTLPSAPGSARTPGTFEGQGPPLTGGEPVVGSRPRQVDPWADLRAKSARARTVNQPYVDAEFSRVGAPAARPVDRTRLSYLNLPGKWKTLPGSYQDDAGEDFLVQMDETTGKTRRVPLGAVSSERQLIALENAKRREELAEGNRFKQLTQAAAEFAGMDPIAFSQMPAEFKAPFFQQAGMLNRQLLLGKGALQTANTGLAKDRAGLARSQTKFYDLATQQGGVTPNMQASLAYRNTEAVRRLQTDYDEVNAKAKAAKEKLEALQNPKNYLSPTLMKAPANMKAIQEAQMAYTQALQEAQAKAAQLLQMQQQQMAPPSGYTGGVNTGAMKAPPGWATNPQQPGSTVDWGRGELAPAATKGGAPAPGSEPPKIMAPGFQGGGGVIQGTKALNAGNALPGVRLTRGGVTVVVVGTAPSKTNPNGIILTRPLLPGEK